MIKALVVFMLSDKLWFLSFQLALASITVWAFLRMNIFSEQSPVSVVQRGEKSRQFLSQTAPVVLTAIVSILFTISSFPQDGKVFLYLLDVCAIAYLTLWNGWSTNMLIGLLVKFEQRNFNPHH